MKTAIPPNGVTARCVSRKIDRSADNRAVIWRGTGLSVAFDSTSLLSQILGPHLTPNFRFRDYCQSGYTDRFSRGQHSFAWSNYRASKPPFRAANHGGHPENFKLFQPIRTPSHGKKACWRGSWYSGLRW